MPTRLDVEVQANGKQKQKPAPSGSMLSRAVPVAQLPDDNIKFCIYGPNRVGKTTLACQFPKPLLLIAFEPNLTGGAKSVKKVPGVTFIKVATTQEAIQLGRELQGNAQYKTHVLDGATSLQDVVLKDLMPEVNVDQLNFGEVPEGVYRTRAEKTKEILRLYLDLRANTIVLAKEKDHNYEKGDRKPKMVRQMTVQSYFSADVGGAVAGWLADVCDYIGRLYLDKEVKESVMTSAGGVALDVPLTTYEETGRHVRRLRTLYHPNYAAGFRSETPSLVPEYVEDFNDPKDFADRIMKVIQGIKVKGAQYQSERKHENVG